MHLGCLQPMHFGKSFWTIFYTCHKYKNLLRYIKIGNSSNWCYWQYHWHWKRLSKASIQRGLNLQLLLTWLYTCERCRFVFCFFLCFCYEHNWVVDKINNCHHHHSHLTPFSLFSTPNLRSHSQVQVCNVRNEELALVAYWVMNGVVRCQVVFTSQPLSYTVTGS